MDYISKSLINISELSIDLNITLDPSYRFKKGRSKDTSNSFYNSRTSDFLIFSYIPKDRNENIHKVVFSHLNMYELKYKFELFSTELIENMDSIYSISPNNEFIDVNPVYRDYLVKIKGIDKKSIGLLFDVNYDKSDNMSNGVRILINSKNNSIFLTCENFLSISLLIDRFDMVNSSQLLYNTFLLESMLRDRKTVNNNNDIEEQ